MKICFVMPGFSRTPIGGYKIIYEYANRLQELGHDLYVLSLNENKLKKYHLPEVFRKAAVNTINKFEPNWFNLNKNIVKISSEERLALKRLEDCDVVFATGIQTVEVVKNNFQNSKKFYLIQGYEKWASSEEYLHKTYSYGFCNVVVSSWLKEIVDKYSQTSSILVKNPIDTDVYKMLKKQEDRKKYSIGILYHTQKLKGLKYAMEAIFKLKAKYPELTVEMFGMFPRPCDLPNWINYTRSASQEETVKIYNDVQVFLCASIEEGYGLTGLEAMACGACLVSTAYDGVLEYAKDNENSLLSPVKDVDRLVDNVKKLFEDSDLRNKISKKSIDSVKDFSWEKSVNIINELIIE